MSKTAGVSARITNIPALHKHTLITLLFRSESFGNLVPGISNKLDDRVSE